MFKFIHNHRLFFEKFDIPLVFMREIAFENRYFISVFIFNLGIQSMCRSGVSNSSNYFKDFKSANLIYPKHFSI